MEKVTTISKLIISISKKFPTLRYGQIIENALEAYGLDQKELYYLSDNALLSALEYFYNKFVIGA